MYIYIYIFWGVYLTILPLTIDKKKFTIIIIITFLQSSFLYQFPVLMITCYTLQVKMHMPKVFKVYPNTRVIIDCTEVFIERPTTLLARQQTWSNYKSHNTAKALVGIAPDGGITYMSKAWGGRASDKHIVRNSGMFFPTSSF